jgi:hypothetical protein
VGAWEERIAGVRQPEVYDERASLTIYQNISWFQVTVDDSVLMRILHSSTYTEKQSETFLP